MNRRDFLSSATGMLLPMTLSGMGLRMFDKSSGLMNQISKTLADQGDRSLVIVYLNGGNDGLNTVIPLEYYAQYQSLRPNIAIPANKVLKLSGTDSFGFHPAMAGMQSLYNEGKLAVIHSVGYPNPDRSHARSSEIWMTGTDATRYEKTGWAGRYLESRYPGFPEGYPNPTMTDPLALQIGYVGTPTLLGTKQPMNITLQDPEKFYQLVGQMQEGPSGDLPCCEAGRRIHFVRQQQTLSVEYSGEIKRAADLGRNFAQYPTTPPAANNDLSGQLKIIARLIHGGIKTKIFFAELRGFDTHALQTTSTDSMVGDHATLLTHLSESIKAFQDDLKLAGTEDKVIGLTFSDFGRRANANLSFGTDHGIAAPMFVFGKGIKRQLVGTTPDLVNDLFPLRPYDQNQDLVTQIDFRQIYTDILNDWFGTNPSTTSSLLYRSFPTTSLFSDTIQSTASGFWADRSIWTAGRPPGPKDYVKINPGHVVSLGENITIRNIEVAGDAELKILGDYTVSTTG